MTESGVHFVKKSDYLLSNPPDLPAPWKKFVADDERRGLGAI